ncbi:ribosome biogenesis GTPase Der [Candidatus Dependentiae bacterium]|nr:ribosome biogenesis GTPase Der [Candidatus Dependentiae bacterium]MBU4387424.1 ribosome biogenesis GTPase Der [Candidatus Dependentiae bacterium]MCG2756757.1 ribosome biogenesis GTPase Der [Candidatus Dependentiae bacterium]
MKKNKKYPKVVIVGRTNVGKSTLFNRIAKSSRSIVLELEGVTRDYITEIITHNDKTFELIDTGGVSFKKEKDIILENVRLKVLDLLTRADLILFVCDGKNGLTKDDIQVSQVLKKTNKPIVLLLNKADNRKALEENLGDFYKLGIKDLIEVSAINGFGVNNLLDHITQIIPEPKTEIQEDKANYKVTIIGKPNVGKSSLTNLLLQEERSIVSEIAGTTREAISDHTYISQDLVLLTDTAGVRKKSNVVETIETLMVKSSLSAVRTSNIIMLVADASELKLSDQELKLIFYAYEEKKALIIAFNKTDLITPEERKVLEYNLKEYAFILKKMPIVWISCKNKKNISNISKQIKKLWDRLNQKFNNEEIDELVKNSLMQKPLFHKTIELKLYKISWIEGAKIPTFKLKVNQISWFGPSQLGFIENILRKKYDLLGCPIKFIVIKK